MFVSSAAAPPVIKVDASASASATNAATAPSTPPSVPFDIAPDMDSCTVRCLWPRVESSPEYQRGIQYRDSLRQQLHTFPDPKASQGHLISDIGLMALFGPMFATMLIGSGTHASGIPALALLVGGFVVAPALGIWAINKADNAPVLEKEREKAALTASLDRAEEALRASGKSLLLRFSNEPPCAAE